VWAGTPGVHGRRAADVARLLGFAVALFIYVWLRVRER
jgi:hypothetical protein